MTQNGLAKAKRNVLLSPSVDELMSVLVVPAVVALAERQQHWQQQTFRSNSALVHHSSNCSLLRHSNLHHLSSRMLGSDQSLLQHSSYIATAARSSALAAAASTVAR
jgi:hypothetical protein